LIICRAGFRRRFDEKAKSNISRTVLKRPGKAMIHSSRRDRKTKAIAEALAMIADAHPELEPHRPRPVRETDEWLWESATDFCAALDRYAERTVEIKKENRRPPSAPMPGTARRPLSGSVVAFPAKRVASLPK
jgi:hypothetical protein